MFNGGILPQDIIKCKLSLLPVKSLYLFKCISPSWKSLFSKSQFAKTHCNRTKIKNSKYPEQKIIISSRCGNLYLVDPNDVNPTSTKLEFPTLEHHDAEKWVRVLSSYDGLLLVSHSDKSIFLLNPTTRECKKLSKCPFVQRDYWNDYVMLDMYGVGYDSTTDDYKVLWMLSYFDEEGMVEVAIMAVYSLKTNAWRRIEDFQCRSLGGYSCGVFLNGCVHYLYWDVIRNCSKRIIAFDLSNEIFREVSLPACLDDSVNRARAHYQLEVLMGCLCLIRHHNGQVGVWMREEHGVRESWTKLITIDMPGMSKVELLCLLGENEYLLKANGVIQGRVYEETLVVYDPKKETMRDMVVCGIPTKFTFGVTYVESLISPHRGGGIGRQ